MQNLSAIALDILEVVDKAGAIIRTNALQPHTIHHKGRIDLVTETDVQVENFLKENLGAILPEAVFVAEESTTGQALAQIAQAETCWIIDPVDGTTNFAHGLPFVATSVALQRDGEIVLGIVNAPLLNECFAAEKSAGAWMNGQRIHVSGQSDIEQSLIATGFPYDISQRVELIIRRLRPFLARSQGVRRCGAAALDLAWTACGRFDAYYEDGLKPWDSAAGCLILTEAGGMASDLEGQPYTLTPKILASNGLLHPEMLRILAETSL